MALRIFVRCDAKPALTKEGFGVVADENITSNGIDFVRWYRRFRSPCKHSNAEG
jgi:hypothetical protein